jgi:hypothetical protein
LGTVHDRLDRTFIPEVAIYSQVENIFKMSWSHAITKVAQHNLRPTEQGYLNSYQRRFVKYNHHFNPRFDVKWKRVSLDNSCMYQNVLYSSLLKHLNASDMVMSDHDCYEHEGGGANLVLADRSFTYFYASLLRLRRSLVLLL